MILELSKPPELIKSRLELSIQIWTTGWKIPAIFPQVSRSQLSPPSLEEWMQFLHIDSAFCTCLFILFSLPSYSHKKYDAVQIQHAPSTRNSTTATTPKPSKPWLAALHRPQSRQALPSNNRVKRWKRSKGQACDKWLLGKYRKRGGAVELVIQVWVSNPE